MEQKIRNIPARLFVTQLGKDIKFIETTDLLNTEVTNAILLIIMFMREEQYIEQYELNVNLKNQNKCVENL